MVKTFSIKKTKIAIKKLVSLFKGALFYDDEYEIEESFVTTINLINNQNEVNFKLIPLIEKLYDYDSSAILENKGQ